MAELRFTEVKASISEALEEALRVAERDKKEVQEVTCCPIITDGQMDEACDILDAISDSIDSDMSLACAYSDEVFYVRIYDTERYVFPLPFALSEDADIKTALLRLSEYSRRELIPLIISDIPRDELSLITDIFPHVDASCYEDDDDTFFVRVNNECDLLYEVPTYTLESITLNAITPDDKEDYARLCSDSDLNRYWGYDASADNPDASAEYYLSVVERELNDGVALTLAIRYDGRFAGEAVIYDFDYLGTACVALRILPELHGRGVGSLALRALLEVAREMGLTYAKAEIMNCNISSIKMTSKYFKVEKAEESKTKFTLKL